MTKLVGQQINNYRIEAIIGDGGMGTVYRALDTSLNRAVALKVMHPQYANEAEFQERFRQEAQAAARLQHPSIVGVYQFMQTEKHLFLVMEYVPGLSLGKYMRQLAQNKQVMKLSETVEIIAQVAEALHYAHQQGVVHRDIKPDNILIRPLKQPDTGYSLPLRAMVTDFGLAKLLEGGMDTQTGMFMGTLPYMSPEQVLDGKVDGRSDLYSLGVVLYQMATGKLPFSIRTPTEAVRKHLNERPEPPHIHQPKLPQSLSNIVLRLLARQPEDRYTNGRSLAQALQNTRQQLTQEVEAAFIEEIEIVSVVTALTERPSLSEMQQQKSIEGYRLVILSQNRTARTIRLKQNTFTLGRTEQNEVVIDGENVSRQHARLTHTTNGWQVTDLGSTNGTYIGDRRLQPDLPTLLPLNQPVQIGEFALHIEHKDKPAPRQQPATHQPIDTHDTKPKLQKPANDPFSFDIRPKRIQKQGTCRVLILNKGAKDAQFRVTATADSSAVRFDTTEQTITIPAYGRGIADFDIWGKSSFFSANKTHSFHITVQPPISPPHTLSGELIL